MKCIFHTVRLGSKNRLRAKPFCSFSNKTQGIIHVASCVIIQSSHNSHLLSNTTIYIGIYNPRCNESTFFRVLHVSSWVRLISAGLPIIRWNVTAHRYRRMIPSEVLQFINVSLLVTNLQLRKLPSPAYCLKSSLCWILNTTLHNDTKQSSLLGLPIKLSSSFRQTQRLQRQLTKKCSQSEWGLLRSFVVRKLRWKVTKYDLSHL